MFNIGGIMKIALVMSITIHTIEISPGSPIGIIMTHLDFFLELLLKYKLNLFVILKNEEFCKSFFQATTRW